VLILPLSFTLDLSLFSFPSSSLSPLILHTHTHTHTHTPTNHYRHFPFLGPCNSISLSKFLKPSHPPLSPVLFLPPCLHRALTYTHPHALTHTHARDVRRVSECRFTGDGGVSFKVALKGSKHVFVNLVTLKSVSLWIYSAVVLCQTVEITK
jgi:hypothetical protein